MFVARRRDGGKSDGSNSDAPASAKINAVAEGVAGGHRPVTLMRIGFFRIFASRLSTG